RTGRPAGHPGASERPAPSDGPASGPQDPYGAPDRPPYEGPQEPYPATGVPYAGPGTGYAGPGGAYGTADGRYAEQDGPYPTQDGDPYPGPESGPYPGPDEPYMTAAGQFPVPAHTYPHSDEGYRTPEQPYGQHPRSAAASAPPPYDGVSGHDHSGRHPAPGQRPPAVPGP
ncbi:hypothetical protein G3I29_24425, partial [Streptomyces halstedii]|nr:hypothetical protein [Streptomyces halstedii]